MANVSGIAIVVKAFLPTGKGLEEQFEALSLVKDAHATGDYSKLLAAATIDAVKTEQKVRRFEDVVASTVEAMTKEAQQDEPAGTIGGAEIVGDDEPGDEEPTWKGIVNGALDDEPVEEELTSKTSVPPEPRRRRA